MSARQVSLVERAIEALQHNQEHILRVSNIGLERSKTTDYMFDSACATYSHYVAIQSERMGEEHGFSCGWCAAEDAPSDYDGIVAEVKRAREGQAPFRVWSGASNDTVFVTPWHNHAFRVCHDLMHFQYQRGFTHDDEEWLGIHWTHKVAKARGYRAGVLALCDGLGQVYYGKHTEHEFVEHQRDFVKGLYVEVMHHYQEPAAWLK